jgi:DNA gyrase/topoisomerase IV subunit A
VPIRGPIVVAAGARGKMIRFAIDEVPELTGAGKGVYLMRPGEDDDRIVGAVTIAKGDAVRVVTLEGSERRIPFGEIAVGKRAGKGLKVVKRGGIARLAAAD